MKATFNAKERDSHDWMSIFLKADPRFKIERIKPVAGSPLSLIEVRWTEES